MKRKWIEQASYVWQQTIASSIVADEFSNYCYLFVIASAKGTTSDISQNLYFNA